MGAAVAVKEQDPPNQRYLDQALEYLATATRSQAEDLYEATYAHPGCDDWLIAELGKCDLYFLLVDILRRTDLRHDWLYARCREVEENPDEMLDLWAREHYKSTIITFGLTIQDILRDPEETFGIFSNSRPLAKGFLRQIKQEFEGNDKLKALYPDILWADPKKEAPKWSEDDGIVVKRKGNPKEATVEAHGLIDGMPTGKHFGKLLYDDVVTETTVNTPDMMKKTTEKLRLSYSLGSEGGARRWIGTRYHFHDSYHAMMSDGTATPRIYPATTNGKPNGEPVLLSRESLAKKRRDMGIYIFGCQMMQNPKADESQGFKNDWLEYWEPTEGRGLNKYILVDPASSKKDDADYTAIWVLGLGPDENYYVLQMIRDRLSLTQRAETVFRLHRKYKPLEVRYEEYGLQADIEHIESEMKLRNYRFKIKKVGGKTAKPERIKRLVPLFEAHRIYLPSSFHITTVDGETKDMVHDFVEHEYKAFPVPLHDDGLDSLARIAEPDMPLKWPSSIALPTGNYSPHLPLDKGMGM